jgi:phosphoglycerol transferase MdoB-like AlkP superfamily enzyme
MTNASGEMPVSAATVHHTPLVAREAIPVAIAALGLLVVVLLAFLPGSRPVPADRLTVLFLAICALVCFWTPLRQHFETERNAATYALMAAMFVIYGIARQAPPEDHLALTIVDNKVGFKFSADPEGLLQYISFAARVVILCAIVTTPLLWRHLAEWTKALLLTIALLAVLAAASYFFLASRYPVGVTEVLDPTPGVQFAVQLIEYGALALLCNFATVHPTVRRVALRVLGPALIVMFVRYQAMPAPKAEVSP